MIIDTFSIITSTLLILFSLITPLLNPFFRKIRSSEIKNNNDGNNNNTTVKISVLLLAYDYTQELQSCISAVLGQNYNQEDFEIIVIIEKGDICAETVLNNFHYDKRIHVTFIPSKTLFMSRQKLAISLGVKAAHNEWITIIKSTDTVSENWLSTLSQHFNNKTSLVIGYANYEQETNAYYRFLRLRTSLYLLYKAQHNTAYRSGSSNIAFRKTLFIEGDGYRDNLQLTHGEFDFIINKYAQKGNTAIEISPNAFIREKKPTKKEWNNNNIALYYMNNILHRKLSYQACYIVDLLMMFINYIASIAILITSIISKDYLLVFVSAFTLILACILRTIIAKKAFKQYGEKIAWIRVIPYEISLLSHDLSFLFRYWSSNKNDFITHKI